MRWLLAAALLLTLIVPTFAAVPYAVVPPGTPFTLRATAATNATGYDWEKQLYGGQWATFASGAGDAARTVTDTLAANTGAQYRLRAYNLDYAGVKQFGPWSDPSDWISTSTLPGACGKPAVVVP